MSVTEKLESVNQFILDRDVYWSKLLKADLVAICQYESIDYRKSWSKAKLIAAIKAKGKPTASWSIQPYYGGIVDLCDFIKGHQDPNYYFELKEDPEVVRARYRKEREESIAKTEAKYGKIIDATTFLSTSGYGYIGRDKFITLVKKAAIVVKDFPNHPIVSNAGGYSMYAVDVWKKAWSSLDTPDSDISK